MKVGGWNYYKIISRSFLAWTPLGTARHTGSEHSGREAWTDVNTGLELIPGTLPGGLVLKPPPRSANRRLLVVVAAEAPGLLELVHHGLDWLNLLDPPVGVALLGLEGPGVVVVVVVPVASTASVVVLVSPVGSSPRPAVVTAPAGRWSPVTPSVAPRSSSLESSVPGSSVRSRAGIAAVLGLPGVSLTGGVGLPGPVLGTGGPAHHT